jgi:hypothetical protein
MVPPEGFLETLVRGPVGFVFLRNAIDFNSLGNPITICRASRASRRTLLPREIRH